jgi:hypothetical protein
MVGNFETVDAVVRPEWSLHPFRGFRRTFSVLNARLFRRYNHVPERKPARYLQKREHESSRQTIGEAARQT